jgi:hypothetical protein
VAIHTAMKGVGAIFSHVKLFEARANRFSSVMKYEAFLVKNGKVISWTELFVSLKTNGTKVIN